MPERNSYICVMDETKDKLRRVGEESLGAEAASVPLGTIVSMMADDYLEGGSNE